MSRRAPTYGPAMRARAAELLRTLPQRAVLDALEAEGFPRPSAGWVAGVARDPRPIVDVLDASTSPPPRERYAGVGGDDPPPPSAPAAPPPPDIPADAPAGERLRVMLERLASELQLAVARAREVGDLRSVLALSRALGQALAEIRRVAPEEREADDDDVPGIPGAAIREAARTGREKLEAYVARLARETPRCPHCGR